MAPVSKNPSSDGAAIPIPSYLIGVYEWAYVTPRAVKTFERQWLVNLILWGNFNRLRDCALDALGHDLPGQTLQIACVYGDLTTRLAQRHAPAGKLDVIDVLPIQLENLQRKLKAQSTGSIAVNTLLGDSSAMKLATASYDRALLFFLLHEQPEEVRRKTLAEALRVVKPGGKLVIVDYHRPAALHPLRLAMHAVLKYLEPFALDLWRHKVTEWFPPDVTPTSFEQRTLFGGLYQIIEITR